MFDKMNKALRTASLFFLLLVFMVSPALAENTPTFSEDSETITLRGRIISVEEVEPDESVKDFVTMEQLAKVEITSGHYKGETYSLVNSLTGHPFFDMVLTEGRRVILWGEVDDTGTLRQIYLQDFARDTYLYLLSALFVLVILLVGRSKGLVTVITLGITILAVFKLLLPMLLRGYPPVPTTIVVASAATLITLLAIGGLHRKTFAAVIGTVGGVVVAGILALAVGKLTHLTGFSSEEAQMLQFMEATIDVRGLLFAGIIIGTLGAVMDVAMSISASSHEIYCANPAICVREQINSAMNVGRHIMGTMANTLILAYTGSAMPLLLLFLGYDTPFITVINSDLVATEIVRALAGSIGLIATVPLTAVSAGLLTARPKSQPIAPQEGA